MSIWGIRNVPNLHAPLVFASAMPFVMFSCFKACWLQDFFAEF